MLQMTQLRHWLSPLALRCRDRRRSPGGIGRHAFVQRVERILQDFADAGRAVGIDHVGVEIKIEPGQMLAEYRNGLSFNPDNAVDRIGNDLPADSFHGDRLERVRDDDVADQRVRFVTDHDVTRLRDRLQPGGEIGFRADDRVVHPVVAAEIPHVAKSAVDSHPHTERKFDAGIAPVGVEAGDAVLHLDRHAKACLGVFGVAFCLGIAKEDQDGVADEFVDRAAIGERNLGHLREIFVEELGDRSPAGVFPSSP